MDKLLDPMPIDTVKTAKLIKNKPTCFQVDFLLFFWVGEKILKYCVTLCNGFRLNGGWLRDNNFTYKLNILIQ